MLKGFELRRGRLIYYQTLDLEKQDKIEEKTPYYKSDYKNSLQHPYLL
jgi:hypothetical protein